MKALFLLFLTAGAVLAQNTDLGLLLGVSGPTSRVDVGTGVKISNSVGGSGQVNFAFQVSDTKAGRLYVELPVLFGGYSRSSILGGNLSSSVGGSVYFTPGVRWNIFPHSRVSLYAALGGGPAAFQEDSAHLGRNLVSTTTSWTVRPAVAFGGGLDFRLTRLLSLRMEARDFVSGKGLGGVEGRNHVIYGFGLGFHW
jgi:hypothetical protein